ncbi:hypothetical protein [Aurantimonas sp. VKM B-3413]|uniref:hypothetical protein n=1 Tax=Aurantimonas sp. VKM B-3413 TaxID=2779401 RepID=UPI001E62C2A6|nr:hypothetical protein [Aurantimonas sp. VKM B-3413]MCB8839400.1 hypothetical protein [Aurantimonas sp. VKM B-3413]
MTSLARSVDPAAPSWQRWILTACLAVFLVFFAMTLAGYWQPDEYANAAAVREFGLDGVLHRMITWSPRPFSEFVLYLYQLAVAATGRQLIAPMLMGLWLILFGLALLPALRLSGGRRRSGTLLALVLLLHVILARNNSELLYWVQGAAAYLPTVSAFLAVAGLACFCGIGRTGVNAAMAALLVLGATSAEVGSFFALTFSALVLVAFLLTEIRGGSAALGPARLQASRPERFARNALAVLPFLISLCVSLVLLVLLVEGRVSKATEGGLEAAATHLLWPSVLRGALQVLREAFLVDQGLETVVGLAARGLFLLGATAMFVRLADRGKAELAGPAALFLATVATGFLSTFGAFYQFGLLCCERHASVRRVLVFLALLAAARIVAACLTEDLRARLARRGLAELALALSVAVPLAALSPALVHDVGLLDETLAARRRLWQEGQAPGPDMLVVAPPPHRLFATGFEAMEIGVTRLQDAGASQVRYVLDAFSKDEIRVLPPFSSVSDPPPLPLDWIGDPLTRHVEITAPEACLGAMGKVPEAAADPLPVEGWSFDLSHRRPPPAMLLTDAAGTVRAVAPVGRERPDVPRAVSAVTSDFVGWQTTYPKTRMPAKLYALLDPAHACPIAPR